MWEFDSEMNGFDWAGIVLESDKKWMSIGLESDENWNTT